MQMRTAKASSAAVPPVYVGGGEGTEGLSCPRDRSRRFVLPAQGGGNEVNPRTKKFGSGGGMDRQLQQQESRVLLLLHVAVGGEVKLERIE